MIMLKTSTHKNLNKKVNKKTCKSLRAIRAAFAVLFILFVLCVCLNESVSAQYQVIKAITVENEGSTGPRWLGASQDKKNNSDNQLEQTSEDFFEESVETKFVETKLEQEQAEPSKLLKRHTVSNAPNSYMQDDDLVSLIERKIREFKSLKSERFVGLKNIKYIFVRNNKNKDKNEDENEDENEDKVEGQENVSDIVLEESKDEVTGVNQADESKAQNESITGSLEENIEPKDINREYDAQKYENTNEGNRFNINADKITYSDETGAIEAFGHVEITAPAQDVRLLSDSAVFERNSQIIKLKDNVKILKAGLEMTGDYLNIDLNEQNILMDNPKGSVYSFSINAQEGYLISNNLEMLTGSIKSDRGAEYLFYSRRFASLDDTAKLYNKKPVYKSQKALYEQEGSHAYKIHAKKIIITSESDHNSLLFKSADIYYNNHKIVRNMDFEIISDKDTQTIETSMPEIGTLKSFGTYFGYGFVHRLPYGQSLKIMPAAVLYNSKLGIGVIGRHRSKNSMLEAGWATSSEDIVARGKYRFGKNLNLMYGRHAYLPEGFMGARRSGYAAQLEYRNSYTIGDLGATFSHAAMAGVFSDYKKKQQEKHAYATSRFRYMAQLSKNFLSYRNKEQDLSITFGGLAQAAATVYGSGERMGIVRVGPRVSSKVRRWESSMAYLLSGVGGYSPFKFDAYRYGKSTIMLNERFHFSDKIACGVRINISPLKDNPDKDLLTEARIYAMVGPRDLKLSLSYDFVRENANFDFLFLLGSESTKIDFDKLITKEIEDKNTRRDFYRNAKSKIRVEENI